MGDAEITASKWKLVEVGRVALINSGPYAGRIAAIVQIIDHKRVCMLWESSMIPQPTLGAAWAGS